MNLTKLVLVISLLMSCGGKQSPEEKKPERIVTTETKVEILEKVSFDEGATLSESSDEILKAIALTLEANQDILELGVQASADNQELADSRGQAIIDALVANGVDPERLSNNSKIADGENVEFIIVRRK